MSVGMVIFCIAIVVLHLTISFASWGGVINPHDDFDPLIGLIVVALIAAVGVFLWWMR